MSREVLTEISGNIGDQLFIIAYSYSYSKRENSKLKILKSKISYPYHPVYWETLLKKIKPYLIDYHEDYNKYKICYEENENNYDFVYLKGKFQSYQSYKYFSEYKEELKDLFKPEKFLVKHVTQKYKSLFDQKDRVVVIHCSSNLTFDYYKRSIDLFINNKPNPLFFFYIEDDKQDDIRDTLTSYIRDKNKEYFIFKDDDILTFTILQQFNDFILSNSSLLWWCVWLSNYKHVIVPKEENNLYDLYEKDWIRV